MFFNNMILIYLCHSATQEQSQTGQRNTIVWLKDQSVTNWNCSGNT
jgi:hypothetical protein